MKLSDFEAKALKLSAAQRARLAARLLESLDNLSESEIEELWLREATRRGAELDQHPSRGRPGKEVFRSARAKLK